MAGYSGTLLAPLPDGASIVTALRSYRRKLHAATPVWVSWPKKSARVPTDITEDAIRKVALPLGYVDIKVCAVSVTWSALKLVVRKELRGGDTQ